MIMTGEMMIEKMKAVKYPRMKLSRDVKSGKVIRLKRDLYETNKDTSPLLLAQSIYGPSYISFDYALSFYGMIPETAYSVTSATYMKRRDKAFHTDICSFYYSDVPENVFPLGVLFDQLDGEGFFIASREKAICDKLYKIPPCRNMHEFEDLIYDDLRVFEDAIAELDVNDISALERMYRCRNVTMLNKLVREAIA